MSEKKVFKQTSLFNIFTSPKPTTTTTSSTPDQSSNEKSPPKTPSTTPKAPKAAASRKRKPSSDGDNVRSSKIGRLTSKENIAEPSVTIALDDSDDDNKAVEKKNDLANKSLTKNVETTPTSEGVIHIKIKSSRRKQDLKAVQKIEEEDPDDSVVYLDKEELQMKSSKKVKKSAKKSEKKKRSIEGKSSGDDTKRVKKSLNLNEEAKLEENSSVVEVIDDETEEKLQKSPTEALKTNEKSLPEAAATEEPPKPAVAMEIDEAQIVSDQISKLMNASGTTSMSGDIQEYISDDEQPRTTESELNSSLNSSLNKSVDHGTPKVLTPKQLARRKEFEEKRLERELLKKKEREEKELQRLKEKEQREEAKRKEKEEKEEQRKREKDEKEKKRLAELEKKEEERKQKEEERKRIAEQKEEEKRVKEEERKRQNEARDEEKRKKEIEKQKEEERKKKVSQAFTKFFVPVKKKAATPLLDDEASKESAESAEMTTPKSNFMPFQVHGKMKLAPCVRSHLSVDEVKKLEAVMDGVAMEEQTYLKELKNKARIPKSSGKTWPNEENEKNGEDEDEVMVVDELEGVGEDIKEDEAHLKMKHRAKFLMFCENRRPAFYGTWRKSSVKVSPRNPFAIDQKYFDYEVDSDDEWEEEEPGESLHGSDSEKEKEVNEEEYEVDNDFFVPHGHLSDDELNPDGEVEIEDNTPETQKAKLKILQQEFAAEMKKKTEKIKPRLIGCIWMNGDEDEDGATMKDLEKKYHCSNIVWRILKAREMWSTGEEIKMEDFEPEILEPEEDTNKVQKTPAQQKTRPKIEGDESIREFIRLIHGNTNSKKYLIREYQAYRLKKYHMNEDFQEFSVKSIEEKMLEVAVHKSCPDDGPLFGKKCWYVKADFMKQYFGDEKLPIPNQWRYILEKEVKEKKPKATTESTENCKKGSREVSPVEATSPGNKKEHITTVKESPQTNNRPSVTNKKRVPLIMSVPRGAKIDEDKKNNLISQFLSKKPKEKVETAVSDNGVIEIID